MKHTIALGMCMVMWLFTSCTSTKEANLTSFQVDEMEFSSTAGVNQGDPMDIDIVFAYDAETLKDLEGFTASGWASVRRTNLGNWNEKIVSKRVTLDPGESLTVTDFPDGYDKAVGIVVFAHYKNPGLNRLVYNEVKKIKILFQENSMMSEKGKVYFLTSPPEIARPRQM